MYINLKKVVYINHSEAHTQLSHFVRLGRRKYKSMMMSLKKT